MGDRYVGIRSGEEEIDRAVRELFSSHVVETIEAPPNFSIRREPPEYATVGGRGFLLYRGHCFWMRSMDLGRILRVVEWSLGGLLDGASDELLRLRMIVLVDEGGAILLPREFLPRMDSLEAQLSEHGIHLADPPFAVVDVRTGEIVVEPERLDSSLAVEAALGSAPTSETSRRPASAGRYRVRAWGVVASNNTKPVGPAAAVASAVPLAAAEGNLELHRSLEVLGQILSQATVVPVWYASGDDILRRVIEVGRG